MKSEISASHVAVLVPSIRKAADYLRQFQFEIGEEEDFEETREIYIQGAAKNPLLLMEAKETGSYRRALQKRGPGIHHFAIDVLDLDLFLSSQSESGWLLHLNSLKTIKAHRTAYLAKPGFPALIEVQEKKKLGEGTAFVERVLLKFDVKFNALVKSISLNGLIESSTNASSLIIQGKSIEVAKLF